MASFAIASFTSAQAKGRDSRRKSDLNAVKTALELTRQDCTGGTYYPVANGFNLYLRYFNLQSYLRSLGYVKSIISDPISTSPYFYGYDTVTAATAVCPLSANGSSNFTLSAVLENTADPAGQDSFNRCTGRPGVPGAYTAGNYYVCND